MVRRVLTTAALLMTAAFSFCSPEAWNRAKAAYDNGDFPAAQEQYDLLVQGGWGGEALYHNLGNTYYRLGNAGQARLWFERALADAPRDADTRFNRNLILARAGITEEEGSPLLPWVGLLSWLFTGLNIGFFMVLAWRRMGERSEFSWWTAWGMGLALLATGVLTGTAWTHAQEPWAVVTASRAEARSAPSEEASVGFTVPESQKVVLLRTSGPWAEIGLPSKGLKGWVDRENVERVKQP